MQDIVSIVRGLRRPRLLIRAARIGAEDYRRDQHLPRLLGYGALPRPGAALMRLMEMERAAEEARRAAGGTDGLMRQLDLLIAILGEVRLLERAHGGASERD